MGALLWNSALLHFLAPPSTPDSHQHLLLTSHWYPLGADLWQTHKNGKPAEAGIYNDIGLHPLRVNPSLLQREEVQVCRPRWQGLGILVANNYPIYRKIRGIAGSPWLTSAWKRTYLILTTSYPYAPLMMDEINCSEICLCSAGYHYPEPRDFQWKLWSS